MLLSRNYAPSDALAPYVARFYVFEADLPEDFEIIDGLMAETAFVRILTRGDWQAEIAPGIWGGEGPAVLFGANTKPFRVRVGGPFSLCGFAIRPSGWKALMDCPHSALVDQVVQLETLWGSIVDTMMNAILLAHTDEAYLDAMHDAVTARLNQIGRYKADPEMALFEQIARTDSTCRIDEAAAQIGLSVRQMERRCAESFGASPKVILRRSRFLDMAAAMRGFSSASGAELAALRYFDQSHLNREFRRFANMTPGAFNRAFTPLLTAGLKLREDDKETY
jgi:AraC-like DNA-binding protein